MSLNFSPVSSQRLAATIEMTVLSCATCGVAFAVPQEFYKDRAVYVYDGEQPEESDDDPVIFCPSGHCTTWYSLRIRASASPSQRREHDKMKRQVASLQHQREQLEAKLRDARGGASNDARDDDNGDDHDDPAA